MDIHAADFPLIAGLLAAMVHVLTGPDHLAAVMPLAVENYKKSWKIGAGWGLGHITGMMIIGVLFILFREIIPVDKISEHSEMLVGFVLVFIGAWVFYRIFSPKNAHTHPHFHDDDDNYLHVHKHRHDEHDEHTHAHKTKKASGPLSAFGVGTIHGLAGISHFIIFIPALGLSTVFQSVMYLAGFAAGTLIAMTSFAIVMGKVAEKSDMNHESKLFTGIRFAAGTIAVVVGVYWIFAS